ncbi:MAG: PQQ-like beta-propeller repeat protein [Ignavibacteriales bacterium]|nr:MAG: PQQ-like beta-propeller repeat protein [Ignavibacteriales bacterium]
MKRSFLFILVIIILQLSCKENTITPPDNKPPGWQEDIPWPSLADSPWPMYRHDAQNTGRSNFSGLNSVNIQWNYDSLYMSNSVVIGYLNECYVLNGHTINSTGGLKRFSFSGFEEWSYDINHISNTSTPIITKDSAIIFSTFYLGDIVALNKNGSLLWRYETNNYITSNLNIDLQGNIYFVDSTGTLYAISSNGNYQWSLQYEQAVFGYGSAFLTFSPDGKVLYVKGSLNLLYAIDITQKQIKWIHPGYFVASPQMVDSYGNIYLTGEIPPHEISYLKKLNGSGDLEWIYYWGNGQETFYSSPTIHKNGSIYFGSDTLYALSFEGKLKWKLPLDNKILSHLVCDANGNIYVSLGTPLGTKLISVNDRGEMNWTINLEDTNPADAPALANGFIYYPGYRSDKLYLIK